MYGKNNKRTVKTALMFHQGAMQEPIINVSETQIS